MKVSTELKIIIEGIDDDTLRRLVVRAGDTPLNDYLMQCIEASLLDPVVQPREAGWKNRGIGTPTGIENILSLGRAMLTFRQKSLEETGATNTKAYGRALASRIEGAGLSYMAPAMRQEVAELARDEAGVRAWAETQKAINNLAPSGVLYRWRKHKTQMRSAEQ